MKNEVLTSINFRDLGGLRTRTGAVITSGRLYRSGTLTRLPPDEILSLAFRTGIRTIIDLRTSAEIQTAGRANVPSFTNLHRPLFETTPPHWKNPADRSPQATASWYLEMLEGGIKPLVQIVEALGAENTVPAVIHCMAGRDRTGIVVACLLDLLGVSDDDIASDYALSDGFIDDAGLAVPMTMSCFLSLIRKKYGSSSEFLHTNGASKKALSCLQVSLLEARR
jgi:protein-tyrosine phosphatase